MHLDEGRSNLWTKKSTVAEIGECMHVMAAAPEYRTFVMTVYHDYSAYHPIKGSMILSASTVNESPPDTRKRRHTRRLPSSLVTYLFLTEVMGLLCSCKWLTHDMEICST